jgi:hypothetical protein
MNDSMRKFLGAMRARLYGTLRQKEKYQLLGWRPHFAYGLLKAADVAQYFGHQRVTVCEFGVATGAGLLSMCRLAQRIGPAVGVQFDVFGFDSGTGLPRVTGHKDHAEMWQEGDYPMVNQEQLRQQLDGQAQLVLGDIATTVDPWLAARTPASPIGFIAVDVDIYSSTVQVLRSLLGPASLYLPAVSVYLDDTEHFFANDWCGELAAVHEFNATHALRKIGADRTPRHADKTWFRKMHVAHILDHPARNVPGTGPRKTKVGGNLPAGVLD